jgi:signal peptidase II
MKLKKIFRTLIILTIVITNISCDQISKAVVRKNIAYHENIEVIKSHSLLFLLTKVENKGAFLSFGDDFPQSIKNLIFMFLPLLALTFALIFLLKNNKINKLSVVGLCFVIGGGIGNIYDRILYGSVTDFLYLDLAVFQTGIFNLADVSVMLGVLLMIIESFRKQVLT